MNIIQGITDEANQRMTLAIEGGTQAILTLKYREQQQAWYYDLSWNGAFYVNGRRLVVNPNNLRQFKNVLPFGLMLAAASNLEPIAQNAFLNGTATLVLLNAVDVLFIESTVFPGL
jgi:hypothetical protein